MFGKNLEIVS